MSCSLLDWAHTSPPVEDMPLHHAESVIADELTSRGHHVLSVIAAKDMDSPQYVHLTILCQDEEPVAANWHRQDLDDGMLRTWVQTRWTSLA